MKLLICASEYHPYGSGIANVAYNVVEQLKKRGVNCVVCSPTGPDIELGKSKFIENYGIFGLLYYWYKVSKYFKKRAAYYDIVWLHNPLFLKDNPFKNSVATMNATYYASKMQWSSQKIYYYKIAPMIERYCSSKIGSNPRFTGVGTNVCKELEEMGITKERITYIPNGVDTERFKPSHNKRMLRKKFGIPEEDLIILSLGRLSESKQPQRLIKVFSIIEKKMKNVTLVIAGRGRLFEPLKEYTVKKNIKNIEFLGFVPDDDLLGLYASSDYFIIASKYEGGEPVLTVTEAMASGLPCIVSDIPNLRLIEKIKSGIVVDFNDTEKAAVEIIGYLHRDNSEHSRNAREYAVNNLDWKIIAERYLDEFEKIISTLGR